MLDIKFIRQYPEEVKKAMANRHAEVDVALILELDKHHKELLLELENARAEQNKASKIQGKPSEQELVSLRTLKDKVKVLQEDEGHLLARLLKELARLPNIPLKDTPVGKDGTENIVLREVGTKPSFKFTAKPYEELSEKLGIIDTETAGTVSGTRFGYLKGGAVRLEFALVQLVLDRLTDAKFIGKLIKKNKLDIPVKPFLPVVPPVMIKTDMMKAMGYVEYGGDEIYYLEKDGLYLVGTSEQSIGPMHYDKTYSSGVLPFRYVAFSSCFRREAGSYGKDTKGILRVHQFDKLEMFGVCAPEASAQEHLLLLAVQEALMQELEIPYRAVRLCTGDIGAPSAGTFDIEAWLPGQGEYRETHSTSNTTDYQARRLNTRIKDDKGAHLAHMLNGTAFAIGRTLIAIIENYQTEKGTVKIPKALQKYTGELKEIV